MSVEQSNEELLGLLDSLAGDQLIGSRVNLGHAEISVNREALYALMEILRNNSDLQFNMLLCVSGVDFMDEDFLPRPEDERFEVVYHLLSIAKKYRLRVKVALPEDNPEVDSVVKLWSSADFMEREVWDMYGIRFKEHPNLKRILMYDEFEGFPLRKDYPLRGKQPRIELRHPEVHNTSADMLRPALVQINRRSGEEGEQGVSAEARANE